MKGLLNIFKYLFDDKKDGITAENLFKDDYNKDDLDDDKKTNIFSQEEKYLSRFVKTIDYDVSKETIILLDDNPGVVSFLHDDFNFLNNENLFSTKDFNILSFTTKDCGFELISFLRTSEVKVFFCVFDISLGGVVFDKKKGNIILDGVDVFIETHKLNPEMKFVFFTGNKLNEYIKKNKDILDKFKDYYNDDIKNYLIYKTMLDSDERRLKFLKTIKE